MSTAPRARADRIEFRTTEETRRLIQRAVEVSGLSLTAFAETSLKVAAQRTLADRERFALSDAALETWDAINERPARELAGLRALMDRPSPFAE